ncbi:MAG: TlpA disulfide reductase family protein [Dehalococcoidia bacterium]
MSERQPGEGATDEAPPAAIQRLLGLGLLGAAVVAAVGVGVYVFASGGGDEATGCDGPLPQTGVLDPERPEVGSPAPDFALVDARDECVVAKLSDHRGKAVVLNFYASWCGPCRREIPTFQAAQLALRDEVVFLGIDKEEGASLASGILEEFDADYPALLDSDGDVSAHYRLGGLPVTFFIDAEGVLRSIRTGEVDEEMLRERLAEVGVTWEPGD